MLTAKWSHARFFPRVPDHTLLLCLPHSGISAVAVAVRAVCWTTPVKSYFQGESTDEVEIPLNALQTLNWYTYWINNLTIIFNYAVSNFFQFPSFIKGTLKSNRKLSYVFFFCSQRKVLWGALSLRWSQVTACHFLFSSSLFEQIVSAFLSPKQLIAR